MRKLCNASLVQYVRRLSSRITSVGPRRIVIARCKWQEHSDMPNVVLPCLGRQHVMPRTHSWLAAIHSSSLLSSRGITSSSLFSSPLRLPCFSVCYGNMDALIRVESSARSMTNRLRRKTLGVLRIVAFNAYFQVLSLEIVWHALSILLCETLKHFLTPNVVLTVVLTF